MDTAFQADHVATWDAGHALFNTGDFWFVNAANRWASNLWGEGETRYGYVPFPCASSTPTSHTYIGTTISEEPFVMPKGREWAYNGFGNECTTENIYLVFADYYATIKENNALNYVDQLYFDALSKFSSEASIKAYIKVMLGNQKADGSYDGGIEKYGFFEPFILNSNSVVGNYNSGFAQAINKFIKGGDASAQWVDAVGIYQSDIEKSLVEAYG